jgi:hypothetical protein
MMVGAIAPYDSWLSKIISAYETDSVAKKLIKSARNAKRDATYRTAHGALYHVADGLHLVYVPEALRASLIHEFHSSPIAGHFGVHKVYLTMSQH